ncbi:MAG: 3-isopropylmalate dehydratase large subunit, partial [Rhodocyclaceae bacterium]|nr:3-isopropylmalate dehydratase large subunit [Rhodocyclaceae bacterium]
QTTFDYLQGREYAPDATQWADAVRFWQSLRSDPDARFDKEVVLAASEIAPSVTWGTSPEHVLPVDAHVPSPAQAASEEQRADYEAALDYMGLQAGMPLESIRIDQVFIGSCTNGRLEDLRSAAQVARLGKARVPAWVVPGSQSVKRAAEAEGLDRIFMAAGFEWRSPGCSLCTAINGDELATGVRCASTSNR